jgi:integrase
VPKAEPEPPVSDPLDGLSIGEFVELVRSKNLLSSKSIDGYVVRLRTIVADIMGIQSTSLKYAAVGRKAWIERVDSVPLKSLTPDMIRRWKKTTISKAGSKNRKHAVTSVNSTLRQARSLFGQRKVLRFLPVPNPFEGVAFEPRVDTKFYGAGIDAPTLLRRAMKELDTEQLKALLLGLALGLRRKEADLLEWNSFDFTNCTVTVRPTEHHPSLKTEDSSATMSLDAEIMNLFQGWHAQRQGPFVLESDHPPRPDAGYHYYRCDATFDALVDWLRLQGVTGDKPFHVLRKMFGSLIVAKDGIFAASSALRHTSIELTNSFYLDRSIKSTSGLGKIINSDPRS